MFSDFVFISTAPPKVDKNIKDQTVEVGDQFKIKIPYSGTGPIDVKLKKNNHDVPESGRVKITPFDDYAVIVIKGNFIKYMLQQSK